MVTKEAPSRGGIKFTPSDSTMKAPFAGRAEEDEFAQPLPSREPGGIGPEEKVMRQGKVPLHPAAVRLPASILGRVGAELTGYNGFVFTEGELNDLADLWCMCGIEASPILQASIATTAMTGSKFAGYFLWVKQGKPKIAGAESIGKETVGEEEE